MRKNKIFNFKNVKVSCYKQSLNEKCTEHITKQINK